MSPTPELPKPRSRQPFATSWWGQAWIEALEQRARLDPNRLPRGRTYARQARVGALTVEPGEVRAPVLGSRASAYRVRLLVRRFTDEQWEQALDVIAARAAHAAALLDGELSPEVATDLATAGLDLLPGPGDLTSHCSCPDRANPCKHAAAVCYLVAATLDADPFDLLLVRGRARDEVVAGLRARRAVAGGAPVEAADGRRIDPGVPAADVWAVAGSDGSGDAVRPALPSPPPIPEGPGRPVAVPEPIPAPLRLDGAALLDLAMDAAERAAALLAGGESCLQLDHDADLARRAARAADHGGDRAIERLARGAGMHPADVAGLASTWTEAGADGVAVLRGQRPTAPDEALIAAREALHEVGWTTRTDRDGDLTVLASPARLRWGPGDQWYRLERQHDLWAVVAPPDADAVALLGTAPPKRVRRRPA